MDVNKLGTYGNPNGSDWLHANSIDYNADLDQIIISFAKTGEFWIIDHSTTITESQGSTGGLSNMGGDILYRWGNAKNYQRGTLSDVILEFQHDPHWIPNGYVDAGKVMIFNNGKVSNKKIMSNLSELKLSACCAMKKLSGIYGTL
jgi:hypothetical protein